MKYYKVKPEIDNQYRFRADKHHSWRVLSDSIWIANELYTEKELAKYIWSPGFFDVVEVSKKKTYFSFGARFEAGQEA